MISTYAISDPLRNTSFDLLKTFVKTFELVKNVKFDLLKFNLPTPQDHLPHKKIQFLPRVNPRKVSGLKKNRKIWILQVIQQFKKELNFREKYLSTIFFSLLIKNEQIFNLVSEFLWKFKSEKQLIFSYGFILSILFINFKIVRCSK